MNVNDIVQAILSIYGIQSIRAPTISLRFSLKEGKVELCLAPFPENTCRHLLTATLSSYSQDMREGVHYRLIVGREQIQCYENDEAKDVPLLRKIAEERQKDFSDLLDALQKALQPFIDPEALKQELVLQVLEHLFEQIQAGDLSKLTHDLQQLERGQDVITFTSTLPKYNVFEKWHMIVLHAIAREIFVDNQEVRAQTMRLMEEALEALRG